MRLSVSNIAWNVENDDRVAGIMRENGIDAVEICPSKYFPEPSTATEQEITDVRMAWEKRGMEVVSLQALLFGTSGLELFGNPPARENLMARLDAVARVSTLLGSRNMVFGSPKNRLKGNLDVEHANSSAADFFRNFSDRWNPYGARICLEPNPATYGGDFMLDLEETAKIVSTADRQGVLLQLDTGSCMENGDSDFSRFSGIVGHVHASEPGLAPFASHDAHSGYAATLTQCLPDITVSLEMLPPDDDDCLSKSISSFATTYGRNPA